MEEMALQGWVESHVSLAGGTGCSWGLPVGSPTWQTVVPVLAKSCWVRLAQASGWSWAKRHGYGQGGDGSVQSWVMVWGVGRAAVVSQHLSGRCWASHESVVMGWGGGGAGGQFRAGSPLMPRAHQLSPRVAGLCLSYPYPWRRM